jgi:hypothetical protein
MKYEEFKKILDLYKSINSDCSELYDIGLDLMEGKYQIQGKISEFFDNVINYSFHKEGVEWIHWFIYENEYGQKDWSITPTYDSEGNLVNREDKYGAHDENGNPICYSYETLYKYLEQNNYIK